MKKSWDRSARRISAVAYLRRQGMLDVTFENGDRFQIAIESIVSKGRNDAPIDWAKVHVGETGDFLEVPTREAVIEIPWDRIRALADGDFRAHLADFATDRARRIGRRVRALRLEAGLTRQQLASKVGVANEMLAKVESGKGEPASDLLDHLALALGKRLQDFAEE